VSACGKVLFLIFSKLVIPVIGFVQSLVRYSQESCGNGNRWGGRAQKDANVGHHL